LQQRGGAIQQQGDPRWSSVLAETLAATDSDADATDDLTHGFHTYPARMHPRLAREAIARFAQPGDKVLDPFCGSGTVLVEALVAGCRPTGLDLNPVGLRISEVHCTLLDPAQRRRFEQQARAVAAVSEARVRSRARAQLVLPEDLQQLYQAHVLFELSGLREEIEKLQRDEDKRPLMVVFSALLVKFSRLRADTSSDVIDKRIRKGLVTEFFVRKASELAQRWEALFDAAPQTVFPVKLICGDARELPRLLGPRYQADLVLCSPPYGGTYDYARQHALRNAWFGFDSQRFEDREIGARRSLSQGPGTLERWNEELGSVLNSMRNVLSPSGHVLLWMGDAELSGRRLPADEQLARLAPSADLTPLAAVSQARTDPRGGPPRAEHLLLLAPKSR
jgi:16S rRNA G966 N2-methylase RsmD